MFRPTCWNKRDAAYHLAGYPARMTLTKLVENALGAEWRTSRSGTTRERTFLVATSDLTGGRPIAA